MTLSRRSDTEWVCDQCGLYGTEEQAQLHRGLQGHFVRELDAETTAAVRAERRRLSIERAAGFIEFTRTTRR